MQLNRASFIFNPVSSVTFRSYRCSGGGRQAAGYHGRHGRKLTEEDKGEVEERHGQTGSWIKIQQPGEIECPVQALYNTLPEHRQAPCWPCLVALKPCYRFTLSS